MGKIDDLFVSGRVPLHKRYPAKLLKKYEADLKRVIELSTEGHVAPSAEVLMGHFGSEYDIQVAASTIRHHITRIRRNGSLWEK